MLSDEELDAAIAGCLGIFWWRCLRKLKEIKEMDIRRKIDDLCEVANVLFPAGGVEERCFPIEFANLLQ